MYNFKDLIARSYIEHTEEKEYNIAHTYYQEFQAVREGSNASYIFSKGQFYKKLIKELETLIRSTVHNYNVDPSYSDAIIESKDFESWERNDLKRKQDIYDDLGHLYTFKPCNWEETNNAKELNIALEEGLELNDPVRIISPSKTIEANDLVLRKSKLEYLKSEAIRANKANRIEDLDDKELSEITSLDSSNDSKLDRKNVQENFVSEALEIIKPLGGIYIMDNLLNDDDMMRLNSYIRSIIMINLLPSDVSSFPIITVPNQFIRKTIHLVYESIGKKNKKEFIKLIQLFDDFYENDYETIHRKFSSYAGTYEKVLKNISY